MSHRGRDAWVGATTVRDKQQRNTGLSSIDCEHSTFGMAERQSETPRGGKMSCSAVEHAVRHLRTKSSQCRNTNSTPSLTGVYNGEAAVARGTLHAETTKDSCVTRETLPAHLKVRLNEDAPG